ncbi:MULTISPECIES: hypothetical protein [Flavobacterium]|uniref:Uncharacterized protein n=1 Tax=Flavobacterium jumunjinense TaxID=998845 RepID=A0ABV5GW19_9FLAO|nr:MULTISPECIES: hypothetical protein [Flavobacterium]
MTNQIIENTKAFQELAPLTKAIYRQKTMMNRVKSELEIAREIGIEEYNNLYNPRPYTLKVITELLSI